MSVAVSGDRSRDEKLMREALALAAETGSSGDVPVAAIVTRGDEVLARHGNRTLRDQDPTGHAELLAIREAAARLNSRRLDECTLYVTLEPCAMCAGAIVLARMKRVVFGAWDEKAGMAGSVGDILRHRHLNHQPEVRAGVLAEESGALLRDFFSEKRRQEPQSQA